jgi:hypothetical protein
VLSFAQLGGGAFVGGSVVLPGWWSSPAKDPTERPVGAAARPTVDAKEQNTPRFRRAPPDLIRRRP